MAPRWFSEQARKHRLRKSASACAKPFRASFQILEARHPLAVTTSTEAPQIAEGSPGLFIAPEIKQVRLPAQRTHAVGGNLDFVAVFKKPFVSPPSAVPTLQIQVGDQLRDAVYLRGAGSRSVAFRYTVQQGDRDSDGVQVLGVTYRAYVSQGASTSNIVTTTAARSVSGRRVLVDGVAPEILHIAPVIQQGTTRQARVHFSEAVSLKASRSALSASPLFQAVSVSRKDPSVVVLTYSRKAAQGQLVASDAEISSLVASLRIRDKFGNAASAYVPSQQVLATEATGTFGPTANQMGQAFSRLATANAITTSTVRQWIPSKQADICTLPNGQVLYFRTFYDDSGAQVGKLVRLNQDGSLDISFGEGGIATEPNPTNRLWRSFAVGADGAITIAGNSGNGFGVWRYRQDGTLDLGFGNGGWLQSQFLQDQTAAAVGVLALRDGRILVYGSTALPGRQYDWPAAVMLRPDGTRDPSFGLDGIVYFESVSNSAPAGWVMVNARELGDGRIMLATYPTNVTNAMAFRDMVRLNSDGTVDTTYGIDGFAGTFLPQFMNSEGAGLWIPGNPTVITEAGEIIRFGEIGRQPNHLSRRALVKLTASGSLDLSVGQGGVVELGGETTSRSLIDAEVDPEGRVVVVGSALIPTELQDGGNLGQVWQAAGASWRFNTDLTLDTTFGSNGVSYWRPQFNAGLWDIGFTPDSGFWASGLGHRDGVKVESLVRMTAQGVVLSAVEPALFGTLTDGTSGNDSLLGTSYSNVLKSADGDDVVNAGAGADLIVGGTGRGNDRYDGGAGIDTVSYTSALAAITVDLEKGKASSTAKGDGAAIGTDTLSQIENVVGGSYNDTLLGNALANNMVGGRGDDLLDGRRGADRLYGGLGSDTYIVDNPLDEVIEAAEEGFDRVTATVSYALPSHVEQLTLTGKASLQAIGNSMNNTLIGNAASNILIGAGGADVMDGGAGGDIYVIALGADHAAGEVVADSGKPSKTGLDEIRFSSTLAGDSLVLQATTRGIERVVVGTGYSAVADRSGTTALNVDASALGTGIALFGNAGSNMLRGTRLADTLSGGRGRDTLEGGAGSDLFDLTGISVAGDGDVIRDFEMGAGGDRVALSDVFTSRKGTGRAVMSALTRAQQITLNTGPKGADIFVLNDVNEQPDVNLALANDGTMLLAAVSGSASPASLTTSTAGGKGYLLAYDDGNAYLYAFNAGAGDARVTANEVALVAVFDSDTAIAPGAFGAVHFLMQ